ncbi:MAG: hypothetical protein E7051_09515 [Lentisphaerae bacterium]|nr:hypothetical protein [Lentisphaerota bacterium]
MADYIIAPGNADGKILTSTLWQQDGRIVIDGEELSGYTYNRFCPYISTSSRIRSVTGCTNTADAQILYYYLEQGWDLSLSVSEEDHFTLSSNRKKTYYLSETSAVGEGTISEINAILADTDNYASGEFIAALNFFCGVKNHSTYGESTGTSVWLGTYTDGTVNLKAFRAAGFDSYFSIGETNELFFDTSGKKNQLTDLAYSIIRENLDYGEVIRVDIPGHSIYLDGYRWSETSGGYEYHLNYGWGVDSTETRWYSVSEIGEISFDVLGIDLSPKIRVTVSNARNDYYGGAFLRGVERINNIRNDTATTFGFTDDIAGEVIVLDTVDFTSAVDLEFLNWNICLCVSDSDAVVSDDALDFVSITGGIIVNSAEGGTCISAGDETLSAVFDGGMLFSGEYESGFSGIITVLNSFEENSAILLECINSAAVTSGAGDDTLLLKNGSVIAGGVDLGGGNNSVTIESGSALIGSVSGAEDSVELTLAVSDSSCGAMLLLDDDGSELLAAAGGNISVQLADGVSGGIFELIRFRPGVMSGEFFSGFTVTVDCGGEDFVIDLAGTSDGSFSLLLQDDTLLLVCNPDIPVIFVSASETQWTNETVSVAATFYLDGCGIAGEYSLDGGNSWLEYDGDIAVSENCTLLFRAMGTEEYAYKEFTVSNIDTTLPEISSVSVEVNAAGRRASVSAVFSDNVELEDIRYRIGSDGEWQEYTGTITVKENCTIFFQASDIAGNIAESSVIVDQITDGIRVDGDIDGNGVADILMYQKKGSNLLSFDTGAWLMDDEGVSGWGNLSKIPATKRFLGTGWTQADKKQSDIYIIDTRKNAVGAWVTGSDGSISRWVDIGSFDSKTTVLGLGDFNGDGVSDLLLENVNGAVGCSFVGDGTVTWNYFQSLGKEWDISAVGDFNGDGRDDIVLRHDAGFAGCWLTLEDGTVQWSSLDTLSSDMQIVGAGDFNGDGIDDVLLQKGDYFGAWIVRDGRAVKWMGLGRHAGTVEQIADFNDDGIADIRLRLDDGSIGALTVAGTDDISWNNFGSVSSSWGTSLIALK